MQHLLLIAFLFLSVCLFPACSGNPASTPANATQPSPTAAAQPLIDTAKLQSDMNSVLSSLASGKPDTAKLKAAGSDILSTTAKVLSDSGIDQLYGNSNDPAVKAAAAELKKLRGGLGITPASLDSIRKAAAQLNKN